MRTKGALTKSKDTEESKELVAKMLDNTEPMEERPAEVLMEQLDKDPWTGLTERQRAIQELKMRGLSQGAIGKYFNISQVMVHKELKAIKEIHKERGVTIDTSAYAGETISIYEELMIKAVQTFHEIPKDNPLRAQMRLQAINTIANLREKQTRLMVDLGLIQRQAEQHEHTFKAGPTFVDSWDSKGRQKLANHILEAQFEELPDPVPPEDWLDDEGNDVRELPPIERKQKDEEE